MDEQLDFAPCGYLSLTDDGTIHCINQTLLVLLGIKKSEIMGKHINVILTKSSQSFYQLYFFPMIKAQEKVDEMFLTLKSKNGDNIPVFLNAARNKRNETFVNDCIFFPMRRRYEYEQVILSAKKAAEESTLSKEKAIVELEKVRKELECKQKELLELNETLQKLTVTDELTGLHNRRSYNKVLSQNLSLFHRTTNPFSLLMIDIDHFKLVNDTYGHLTGDKILKELSYILKNESRVCDFTARYGGEEFVLILPHTEKEGSIQIAESIRESVETAIWTVPSITVSIGIATAINGDTETTVQSRADEALYISKNKGRNQLTHAEELKKGLFRN
ncbi:sensor domain-containing diguanylate cyclase [Oceanobacillus sp. Castelsardo]|uniref:sensor domain-containing diguanylate cyclase n=1 Tax=Oceanobacillus sp. Castelsardo TaxID=1851204 RepID=UPI000839655C|nr:sensor domain-containing diguanylate cyclase [Oceanobacillus sp. Castelsardo]